VDGIEIFIILIQTSPVLKTINSLNHLLSIEKSNCYEKGREKRDHGERDRSYPFLGYYYY